MKRGRLWVTAAFVTTLLSSCGTYVPDVQDVPGGDGRLLIKAIVDSIHCELTNSVQAVVGQDVDLAKKLNQGQRTASWLDKWGVQGLLTLTIRERTEANPTVNWTPNPVTALFTLAGGLDLSSEATRVEKLIFYYNVSDLAYKETACAVEDGR